MKSDISKNVASNFKTPSFKVQANITKKDDQHDDRTPSFLQVAIFLFFTVPFTCLFVSLQLLATLLM